MKIRVNCPGGLIYESYIYEYLRRVRASDLALDTFKKMGLEGSILQLYQWTPNGGDKCLAYVEGASTKEPVIKADSWIDPNSPVDLEPGEALALEDTYAAPWVTLKFALSVDSEW